MSGPIYKSGYMSLSGIPLVADGREHTFTLRRSVTISADVLDAETKQPIERFEVTRGQDSGNEQIYWQTYNITRGSNGLFTMRRDQATITALKFESDEHLPATLSLGTNDETHFTVEMKKGSGPKGIVVQPNGQPAAGARIVALAPGRNLNISVSSPNRSRDAGFSASDSKGAFTVRAQPDGEQILFLHPGGYAEVGYSNFVGGSTVKLEPWGILQGELIVAGRPGTNEAVLLTPGVNQGSVNYWYEYSEFRTVTDNAGRFVLSNVPPGERRIVRLIPIDQNSWQHSHPVDVTVKPGVVTDLTIGGDGHLIIGQLALSDPSVTVDWPKNGRYQMSSYPKPPPFKTPEEHRAWAKLPSTIAAQRRARHYSVLVDSTGAFRAEEVLPGEYDLNLSLQEPDPNGRPYGKHIGSMTTNVVVPVRIKGSTPVPIDLGRIVIPTRRPSATATPAVRRASVAPQP
jgi:hypothetical protein